MKLSSVAKTRGRPIPKSLLRLAWWLLQVAGWARSWILEFHHVDYIQRRTASTVSLGLVLKHIFEDGGVFWWMVLIIFSNRWVCCGSALTPAPIMMQSNLSLESVSETTLSAVSPRSTRQSCTSYPKSISLLLASCAATSIRLASHSVKVVLLKSINLGSNLSRGLCHIFL